MQKKENCVQWIKRALFYLLGFTLIATGINIAITSDLGISPVSSIPVVLWAKFPVLSKGMWTFLIYSVFVLTQWVILLKQFKWYYLFQIPVAFIFGLLVDATGLLVGLCLSTPHLYAVRLLLVFISMIFIAFGIFFYLEANIISMPGEGVTVAISTRFKLTIPTAKLIFDITITTIALILDLCFFGKMKIVREGTLLCMVGVSLIMKPIMKLLKKPLHAFIYGKDTLNADNTK